MVREEEGCWRRREIVESEENVIGRELSSPDKNSCQSCHLRSSTAIIEDEKLNLGQGARQGEVAEYGSAILRLSQRLG